MTLLVLLLYTLFTLTSAGELLEVNPAIIDIGLVKKLQIECTATADNTLALTTQIRILFNTTEQLGAIDAVSGLHNNSGAVEWGKIVGDGTSVLRLTWNNPKLERAGVYKCEVKRMSKDGTLITKSGTVEVTAAIPDQVTILNYIQKTTSDLEDMKAAYEKKELLQSTLIDRFQRWKLKFFHVSNVFQGRRYYLPVHSNILVVGDAEVMCEIFGGYLVELDTEEEYMFIVSFLGNFTKYDVILTGANDEAMEGNWVNTYSKTPVKYVNWAPGEPNNGRGGNCLYIWRGGGFKLADDDCDRSIFDKVGAYICEIEE